MHLPVLRWGQPYDSLEKDEVVHFSTGEPIASVSRANGGLIQRDMRKAQRARDVLREIPIDELIVRAGKAGELYMNATLPMGDGSQSPDEFARAQSASTGLPEKMCRANMKKNGFVLAEMRKILDSLTRGLALDAVAGRQHVERGVPISFQVQSPVVGLVLPSNSPGVHTLWLPIIPLQIGLVLFPKVTQLDFTGPLQVFSSLPGAKIHLIWKRIEPVTSDSVLVLTPTITFADCPQLDVICVPGGFGTDDMINDE